MLSEIEQQGYDDYFAGVSKAGNPYPVPEKGGPVPFWAWLAGWDYARECHVGVWPFQTDELQPNTAEAVR